MFAGLGKHGNSVKTPLGQAFVQKLNLGELMRTGGKSAANMTGPIKRVAEMIKEKYGNKSIAFT